MNLYQQDFVFPQNQRQAGSPSMAHPRPKTALGELRLASPVDHVADKTNARPVSAVLERATVANSLRDSGFEHFQPFTDKLSTTDIAGTSATPLFRYTERKASSSLDTSDIPRSMPKMLYPYEQRAPSSLTTIPQRPISALTLSDARRARLSTSKPANMALGIKDLSLRNADIALSSTGTCRDRAKDASHTRATFHRATTEDANGTMGLTRGSSRTSGPISPKYDMSRWHQSPWPRLNRECGAATSGGAMRHSTLRPKAEWEMLDIEGIQIDR